MSCILLLALISFKGSDSPVVRFGSVVRIESFPSKYIDSRNVDIWLPTNYRESKSYSVIYMHDGQNLFDSAATWNKQEWGVDETLSQLGENKKLKNCIVVGIWNNGKYRFSEFFPEKLLPDIEPVLRAKVIEKQLLSKPQSDKYLKFIVEELKPVIDQRFSTKPDVSNTFLAGSSMGAVISLYALCEYPGVFGGAACLSTHWPLTKREFLAEFDTRTMAAVFRSYLNDNLPLKQKKRIWFDCGDQELDSLYPPHQRIIDSLMTKKGYTEALTVSMIYPGENHSEKSWSKRLPDVFSWLLKN